MRQDFFITEARVASRKIVQGINELRALQREWDALDYGNTLKDGDGDNAGVTAEDIGAVVHASQAALESVMTAGHATNLHRIL